MSAKIIPFPTQKREAEETYGSVLRGLLEQQFPTNTWNRLQHDALTKLQARIFINRWLGHLDEGRRLKHLIEALTPSLKKRHARHVAHDILFAPKPSFIR